MDSLRNNSYRAAQAILILKVIIVFDVIMIVFDVIEFDLFLRISKNEDVGTLALRRNEIRQLLTGIFYTIVSFCSGIAFMGWFYRAYRNISRLGDYKTKLRPLWAIWSFIIPVVNLYRPYMITTEIWKKNNFIIGKMGGEISNGKKTTISLWWIFWLISILSSLVYLILLIMPSTKDLHLKLSVFSIFSDITDIPAAVLAITMIRLIHHSEKELMRIVTPG